MQSSNANGYVLFGAGLLPWSLWATANALAAPHSNDKHNQYMCYYICGASYKHVTVNNGQVPMVPFELLPKKAFHHHWKPQIILIVFLIYASCFSCWLKESYIPQTFSQILWMCWNRLLTATISTKMASYRIWHRLSRTRTKIHMLQFYFLKPMTFLTLVVNLPECQKYMYI